MRARTRMRSSWGSMWMSDARSWKPWVMRSCTTWETGADTETDQEAQAAVREAERIFREALVRGDVPFAIDADQAPEKLERWDSRAQEADEIVIAPRLMGG